MEIKKENTLTSTVFLGGGGGVSDQVEEEENPEFYDNNYFNFHYKVDYFDFDELNN